MHVASCVDVGSRCVDRRVNDEAGLVDHGVVPANAIALMVDMHHVRDGEEAKVNAIGIDPEGIGLDWVYGHFVSKCLSYLLETLENGFFLVSQGK